MTVAYWVNLPNEWNHLVISTDMEQKTFTKKYTTACNRLQYEGARIQKQMEDQPDCIACRQYAAKLDKSSK